MSQTDKTRWAVDSLVVGQGSFFSNGWVASPTEDVLELNMTVRYVNGEVEVLTAQFGLIREDVAKAFTDLEAACGYVVHATLNHQGRIAAVTLQALMSGGGLQVWECPIAHDLASTAFGDAQTSTLPWRRLLRDGLRVPQMVLTGKWSALWTGAKNRWRWLRPRDADANELLKVLQGFNTDAVLIVDHSLGGGANLFRERQVQKYLNAGRSVAVWTFVPYLLQYELRLKSALGAAEICYAVSLEAWMTMANSKRFSAIDFNNCVGFPRQEEIGAMLVAFKNASGAKLSFYLHDYHMVCPSHFLLNDAGKFCGLPDVDKCRTCLPNIQENLANLFAAKDIDLWRDRWASALDHADNLVYFSGSTRQLFTKAYPLLREDQWLLRPHEIPAYKGCFSYPKDLASFRVGVVGHIGPAKGSEVVVSLARHAKRIGADLEIIVIGTLESTTDELPIRTTGHYKHAELSGLINQYQLHMALMPSVVPETFSYVTHELMQLGVPIMCFDLGAQAEVVRPYAKGCVVPFSSPEQLWMRIQEFKRTLENQNLA